MPEAEASLVPEPQRGRITIQRLFRRKVVIVAGLGLAILVAAAVGYQSEAAFQRAFKKRMGITPAAWRRAAHTSAGGKIAAIAVDP